MIINKRAESPLYSEVVFILLNVIYFSALCFFIAKTGSGAAIYERIYSRQIALIIDNAEPGTNISLNIMPMFEFSDKNSISRGSVININNTNGQVTVLLKDRKGTSYSFFSGYAVKWMIEKEAGELKLEIGEMKKQDENKIA